VSIALYDKPECPFCYRVRTLLNVVGADFRQRRYDDPDAAREWQALTPARTVPVMVHGDLVLTDSAVMLEYLQDLYGGLLPEEPADRARIRALVHYADNPLGRGSREVVFAKRGVPEAEWDHERIDAGTEKFLDSLPWLDDQLADRRGFAEGYTLADAALSTRLCLSAAYGLEIPARFGHLRRWFDERLREEWLLAASPPVVLDWLAARREHANG
jgi:glutathione S-transferase